MRAAALLFDRFDRTELARNCVSKTKQRRGVAEAPAVTAPVPARVHLTPWTDRRGWFPAGFTGMVRTAFVPGRLSMVAVCGCGWASDWTTVGSA